VTKRKTTRSPIEVLLELTRRLTEQRPLEEALQHVTDAALALLPAEHTSVRILDDSRTLLLSGARSGRGAAHKPVDFRPGEGIAGWVVAEGRPTCVRDTTLDPRFVTRTGQGFAVRAIVAAPLWSGGQVIGVLAGTSSTPGAFGRRDEALTVLLANCAVPPVDKARLERLAITDPHTMAYNQRYLLPRLREELAAAQRYHKPLSLLLLDFDRFKRVNDRWGHAAGDRLLTGVVERVRGLVRSCDLLFRRGGDEFVVLLPMTGLREARTAAERIRRAVRETPFVLGPGQSVTQTLSLGVAAWDGRESAEAFEARADAASYAAKHAGRDKVCCADAATPRRGRARHPDEPGPPAAGAARGRAAATPRATRTRSAR
jgi:diguanylate cyclase (GGDEF)-like protein